MKWEIIPEAETSKTDGYGVYFLKTTIIPKETKEAETKETKYDESDIWTIYNCIREIESGFRCMKSDLDLRPIFHKRDESSMAHLHLGMLVYWLVNQSVFN
ncbi:MAG: hypothetical protein LBR10_13915 [Prevotellaceae bacterium]|jgi:hypothetical protein|nr:hypothetical protein [Prevotellaceae bacterium]